MTTVKHPDTFDCFGLKAFALSLAGHCSRLALIHNPIPVRWLQSKQVMNKEVIQQPISVRASCTVPAARNKQQIVFLVRFDQRVHDLKRRRRIDVCVHLRNDQKEFAFELVRVVHV